MGYKKGEKGQERSVAVNGVFYLFFHLYSCPVVNREELKIWA